MLALRRALRCARWCQHRRVVAVPPPPPPSHRVSDVVKTRLRRLEVIHDPSLNRGSGFSADERERLSLRGLVPPRRQPLEQQIKRVLRAFNRQKSDLDKFQFLSLLMDRNNVLFYRILRDYFPIMAPIVYTPTVGEACQKFHSIYRRTRGMYFSVEDRGHFASMVWNWPHDDVDVIVVTDGSRVLALGDWGASSMNIPIGKLSLYVSTAGINPRNTLPVVLDVGTNNERLRNHPLYLGVPQPRLQGDAYFELLDEWMAAVRLRWPNALVQFEDFATPVAEPLLTRYRKSHAPVFNDDIQSTGCIALAAVLASLRTRKLETSDLRSERIVCVGAGSAGLGVCDTIVQAMERDGIASSTARENFYIVDDKGLLGTGRETTRASELQRVFMRKDMPSGMSLLEVVSTVKPTVLMGLSGQGGLFTEEVVREMAKHVAQPVVFPMSNPLSASECTAEQAFEWTGGRAIFASGSPFADADLGDGRVGISNQANNVYSFPGLGLAVTVLQISHVTDSMFLAAARTIADMLPAKEVERGQLFPGIDRLRDVSLSVAASVAVVAMEEGLARRPIPPYACSSERKIVKYLGEFMWEPRYGHIVAE